MTREEAIAIIRREYLCVDRDCDIEKNCGRCDLMMPRKEPLLEAYKMAMDALEKEPCGDAVSRQALLEDFGLSEKTRKWGGDHSGYNTMMLYEIQDMIESAPSVNPQHSGDLISRQDAIKAIDEKAKRIKNEDTLNGLAGAVGILFDLPPVKPQEPKTGIWVEIDEEPHEVWECDHCGFVIDGSGCIDPYDYRDTYKYCPNCGARMD